jgi:hypothetical protein
MRLQPNRSTLLEIFNTMESGDYVDLQNSGDDDADAKAKADATQSKGEQFQENAYAIHERSEMERKWRSREKAMLKWKCSRIPTMRSQLQNFIALDLAGTQDLTKLTMVSEYVELQSRRLALSTKFPSDNTLWEIEAGDLNAKLAIEGVIVPAS